MTRVEAELSRIIDELCDHVTELGCTCATNEQRNRRHLHPSTKSLCTGVALSTRALRDKRAALRLNHRQAAKKAR